MSALREEIRAILREEIAALGVGLGPAPTTERVRIGSSAELGRFVADLMGRAEDPEFRACVARGEIVFELAPAHAPGTSAYSAPANIAPIVQGPARPSPARLEKTLVTERDIAALGGEVRSLQLAPHARLTPLARDEARRKGIRIERTQR
jgi:hypothetical protein